MVLVDLRRRLHVQLAPDGLLGKGLHGIHRTLLSKHLAIRVRHLFGKGRHELGVGGRDLGLDGLRRCKVCGGGACWKYALEAIIYWLLLYFLVHDNRLLFMLELY